MVALCPEKNPRNPEYRMCSSINRAAKEGGRGVRWRGPYSFKLARPGSTARPSRGSTAAAAGGDAAPLGAWAVADQVQETCLARLPLPSVLKAASCVEDILEAESALIEQTGKQPNRHRLEAGVALLGGEDRQPGCVRKVDGRQLAGKIQGEPQALCPQRGSELARCGARVAHERMFASRSRLGAK